MLKVKNPKLHNLPSGYTELEYIESTGAQYIDTSIYLNGTDAIDVKFTKSASADLTLFGARTKYLVNQFLFRSETNMCDFYYNSTNYDMRDLILTLNTDYILTIKDGVITLNNTQVRTYTQSSFTNEYTCLLFNSNQYNSPWEGKVYYFTISDVDGNPRFNGIPAKNSSDEIGIYDTVTGAFFTSATSTAFTAGPEVSPYVETHEMYKKNSALHNLPSGYTELEYIESSETSSYPYIELDSVFDITDKVEIKTGLLDLSQDKFLVSTKTWNPNSNRFVMAGGNMSTRGVGLGNSVTGSCVYTPSVTKVSGQVAVETYENYVFTYTEGTTVATCDKTGVTFGGSTDNIRLFYGYNTETHGQFYYWKHWKVIDGTLTLVEHLIPAKNSSDVSGMYDLVSGEFFVSETSAVFIAGPEVENYQYISELYKKNSSYHGLPSGYTELEYIESSGTQYIDTGIVPQENTMFEIDGKFNSLTSGRNGTIRSGLRYYFGVVDNYWIGAINSSAYNHSISTADTNRHIFKIDKTSFYIDGTSIYTSTYAASPNNTIFLFSSHNDDEPFNNASMRIYSSKIYGDGSTLSFNGIPAKNSSDVVGMYDTVSQAFYTNAGTGTFTAGPEVEPYKHIFSAGHDTTVTGNPVTMAGARAKPISYQLDGNSTQENYHVGVKTANPATISDGKAEELGYLEIQGNSKRTITINDTEYIIPDTITLYTSVDDTDGNTYTPTGYVYPALQGSTFGLYHFDTGVFQTEV